MCGILAAISDRWAKDFGAALDTLASRGPDDRGEWHDGPVHLGHRRLSVIDLTAAGHQPMLTTDGRYAITFNGEIYNFPALRKELETSGITMRGHSDTEVLLYGFAHWGGPALLKRLDGIFAFAVWDKREQTLFGARDRFGIKPLYYSTHDGLIVSSTLEPFWKFTGFPRRVHYPALRDYLCAQSVFVPDSILRDVRGLEQGCYFQWSMAGGRLTHGRYFDIPPAQPSDMSFEDLVDAVDVAIDESVRRQMVADVPLGAFLSGGIDSSLMVHYMAKHSSRPVKTFSVSFPGMGEYDESKYANMVAQQYGTEHFELTAHESTVEDFRNAAASLDQPLADPAFLPTKLISELTRQHVTVAISGDGGDELFGGYGRFLLDASAYPDKPSYRIRRKLLQLGLLPGSYTRRTLRGSDRVFWNRVRLGPWPKSRKDIYPLMQPEAYAQCEADRALDRWRTLMKRYDDEMTTEAMMRADLWTYLSDNCLVKTDRASMAHALEVRVPLLGNPVVDQVLAHPHDMKMHGGNLKAILKALADRYLQREVWDRPKHGFGVPLREYFATTWKDECEALLADCEKIAPFLNAKGIRWHWHRLKRGRDDARAVYTMLHFIAWARTHPLDP